MTYKWLISLTHPTGNAPTRRETHQPDGKRTNPPGNAPTRRETHQTDGKRTNPTGNAPTQCGNHYIGTCVIKTYRPLLGHSFGLNSILRGPTCLRSGVIRLSGRQKVGPPQAQLFKSYFLKLSECPKSYFSNFYQLSHFVKSNFSNFSPAFCLPGNNFFNCFQLLLNFR